MFASCAVNFVHLFCQNNVCVKIFLVFFAIFASPRHIHHFIPNHIRLDKYLSIIAWLNLHPIKMFSFNMFAEPTRPFNTMYKCYSVSMLPGAERDNVDRGGRILLPPSALDQLTRLNIVYPMLFKLTNQQKNRVTHCGVLEFVADEGKCYMPYWMMRNLLLDEGAFVNIESVSLPVATFSKFQPQSVEFLDITNPKAVLENELRSFACLTTGDVIAISYNDRIYELCVLETKPESAVSIIECDMNVDFAPPVGYVEPTAEPKKEEPAKPAPSTSQSRGFRIDGKSTATTDEQSSLDTVKQNLPRGQPDYESKIGYIKFWRENIAKS